MTGLKVRESKQRRRVKIEEEKSDDARDIDSVKFNASSSKVARGVHGSVREHRLG